MFSDVHMAELLHPPAWKKVPRVFNNSPAIEIAYKIVISEAKQNNLPVPPECEQLTWLLENFSFAC
jgi:hypothetical protein